MTGEAVSDPDSPVGPGRGRLARAAVFVLTVASLLLAVNQVFLIRAFGFQLISTGYYYALIGTFLSIVFLQFPARQKDADRLPLYDVALALTVLACGLYFAGQAESIISRGWDFIAPPLPMTLACVLFLLVLEALRRTSGLTLFLLCTFFGLFPTFAGWMPGILWGTQYTPLEAVAAHVMGVGSIVGIPIGVVSDLLIGYLLFGATLTATGGGKFFMDLASALLGHARGGPAKVSIISSALFGSLSGSVISNVISTGSFTIPTMRRCGYPPAYAAAVESCASTGGTIMPPVMGAAGFIMASFLNIPYATVVSAAIIPALLFYAALLLQVDAYAAKQGLVGMARDQIPPLGRTLKTGWPHLMGLVLLVVLILFFHMEKTGPFISSGLMLAAAIAKAPRRTLRIVEAIIFETGRSAAYLFGILAGIGLIVGALSITGVGSSISRELIFHAGGSVPLLLLFGAITSFVLGMGMTASACYIFLAIILGPALTSQGLDEVGSHLFILYWGMLSYITPPVALAAVTAAVIAGSNSLQTGVKAMRLGSVLFVLPFAFVLNPALIARGEWPEVVIAIATASAAIWFVSCAFEGYLHHYGRIEGIPRIVLGVGGALMLVPELATDLAGLAMALAVYVHGHVFGAARGLAPGPRPE
ncbi:TRAP transporter permease [Lutibaculum baratangense]|uniref:TRAP C4-dicarboxylate transport system permease DctM subunit domain-containing protein n=1 Tax=Lutibaculum baratangense AMV1 TaxID=631454 RepID=V4T8Z5_9HYPH|nr:TRAP transporter fused permease subunit [Lutibaculum baratangense]ESR23013.1 TRAP transporter, 4TM/12TM fusion protein, unknown substrate 2 [Lutibaculum baratangense AMV1]